MHSCPYELDYLAAVPMTVAYTPKTTVPRFLSLCLESQLMSGRCNNQTDGQEFLLRLTQTLHFAVQSIHKTASSTLPSSLECEYLLGWCSSQMHSCPYVLDCLVAVPMTVAYTPKTTVPRFPSPCPESSHSRGKYPRKRHSQSQRPYARRSSAGWPAQTHCRCSR